MKTRLRNLRRTGALRRLVRETTLSPDDLVMPLCAGARPTITFDDGLSWTPDRIRGAAREHRQQRREVLVQLSRRTA